MNPGADFIEAQLLLNRAAAALEAKHPKNLVWLEAHGRPMIARVAWCGVVVVTCRNTGVVLVKSKPGQPTELADLG